MRHERVVVVVLLAALAGCAAMAGAKWPPFVEGLIARQQAEPKKNPPGKIWRYAYQGREVFYVPPSCCDVPGELYDGEGRRLCSPDGGMTGDGDGLCPDFFAARTDEELVWADPRP